MNERRKHNRFKPSLKADVYDPRVKKIVSRQATVQNLSPAGFSLASEDKLHQQCHYVFQLKEDISRFIEVEGLIVYAKTESMFQRSGVKITSISLGNRIRFNRFLARHVASVKIRMMLAGLVGGALVFLVLSQVHNVGLIPSLIAGLAVAILLKLNWPF